MSTALTTPRVFIKDGSVYTNSQDVADFCKRHHKNVLASIRGLLASQHTPPTDFVEIVTIDPQNGQSYTSYDMTRDAFIILVMGFLGDRAMEFKRRYIRKFNEMERVLYGRPTKAPRIAGTRSVALTGKLVYAVQALYTDVLARLPQLSAASKQLVIAQHVAILGILLPPPVISSQLYSCGQLAEELGISSAKLSRLDEYKALKQAPYGEWVLTHDKLGNDRSNWNFNEVGRAQVLSTFGDPA